MKIVMKYTLGDGCSWHSDETYPIDYSSVEDAIVDFENLVKAHLLLEDKSFTFCGYEFDS